MGKSGLLQQVIELVERQHIELRERNLLEVVEVAVLGDDIVGSGCDGTVNELIIILVDVRKQMETISYGSGSGWAVPE